MSNNLLSFRCYSLFDAKYQATRLIQSGFADVKIEVMNPPDGIWKYKIYYSGEMVQEVWTL